MKFEENTGTLYEIIHENESLYTNDVLSIRRLSTASFAKAKKKQMMTGSFHTQWRWYYGDDSGQWIQYEKVINMMLLVCLNHGLAVEGWDHKGSLFCRLSTAEAKLHKE
jgi:hypothetical protein